MPILSMPNRCIWCLCDTTHAPTDVSHVLPECLGNAYQQTLPAGLVCKSCNGHFGRRIEPVLLRDPLIHVIASFLQIVDPGDQHIFREKLVDREHPSVTPVQRTLALDLKLKGNRFELGVKTSVSGILAREYTHRDLRFLSRAVHKIAFESLAWQLYVADAKVPQGQRVLDPLSGMFDAVRNWGRIGQPMNRVRPVFRKPSTEISGNWHVRLWSFSNGFGCEVNLFADWYAVSLTSPPELAEGHLREWTAGMPGPKWLIADSLVPIEVSS